MAQTITVRDLKLLIMGGTLISQLKFINTHYKNKSCYRIEFILDVAGEYKETVLITTRNEPHHWTDLNRAVRFARRLFPDLSVIQLCLRE